MDAVPKNCLPQTAQFERKRLRMMGWRENTEERIGRGLCTVTSVSKLNVTLIGGD